MEKSVSLRELIENSQQKKENSEKKYEKNMEQHFKEEGFLGQNKLRLFKKFKDEKREDYDKFVEVFFMVTFGYKSCEVGERMLSNLLLGNDEARAMFTELLGEMQRLY
ncbi:MAG: uncharacterized protein A8A55_2293 [Amphiamblys sp. WSBS2006]|nr:MAG: uncharacterized protein A8A55_2293 [Amphiamblys sp. WSBS2006]